MGVVKEKQEMSLVQFLTSIVLCFLLKIEKSHASFYKSVRTYVVLIVRIMFLFNPLFSLQDFRTNFTANVDEWRMYYDLPNPQDAPFPKPYENPDQLISLILLKCIRSDKIVPAVRVTFYYKSLIVSTCCTMTILGLHNQKHGQILRGASHF